MAGFTTLFIFGMKKRIKDSFLIGYGIIFPLLLIGILGYMASCYYSGNNGITSYYYYTFVTIPLCTFFSSITLIYIAKEESLFKCGERFITAPIGNWALILSKILPSTLTVSTFNLAVMLVCKFLFKVSFKGYFLAFFLLLIALAFMSCAIGTFIGLCTSNFMAVKNLVSTPILVMGMLGGAFFPIGSLGKGIELLSYISPLTWINRGVFALLNDHNGILYSIALILNVLIGILFTIVCEKKFKKEAFIK